MLYLKAVAWSVFFSTVIAVKVYRIFLIASLFAYLAFAKKCGVKEMMGSFSLPYPCKKDCRMLRVLEKFSGYSLMHRKRQSFIQENHDRNTSPLRGLIFIPSFTQNIEKVPIGQILMGIRGKYFRS